MISMENVRNGKITEKNESDVRILQDIIAEQNKKGAEMPADLDDERYGWDGDGRLTELFLADCLLKGSLSPAGLEELKHLDCRNNGLEALDVSGNGKLEYLCCDSNRLTSLDVTKNLLLCTLNCSCNRLKALDVKANTCLVTLRCLDNKLKTLDLSGMKELRTVLCFNNRLERIDINGCARLETFDCSFNELHALDLSGAPRLDWVDYSRNYVKTLDTSANPLLRTLHDGSSLPKLPMTGRMQPQKARTEGTGRAAVDMEKKTETLIEVTWLVHDHADAGHLPGIPLEQLKDVITDCADAFEEAHKDADWLESDYPYELAMFTEQFLAARVRDMLASSLQGDTSVAEEWLAQVEERVQMEAEGEEMA